MSPGFPSESGSAAVILVSLGSALLSLLSGTKKQPKEKVFGTDIPRTSGGHLCGRPGSKTSGRPSKTWKNNKGARHP